MATKKVSSNFKKRKSVKEIEQDLIKKADVKSKRKTRDKNKKKKKASSAIRTKNEWGITPLQTNFCQIYVAKGNATDAYIESGYKARKTSARANSSKLLTNSNIQLYIKYLMEKAEEAAIAKPAELLKFLTSVARGEIPDQWSDKPSVKDRLDAVKLLGKRHGLFNDKVEVSIGGKVDHIVYRPAVADELIETMFDKDDIIDAEIIKEIETEQVN